MGEDESAEEADVDSIRTEAEPTLDGVEILGSSPSEDDGELDGRHLEEDEG